MNKTHLNLFYLFLLFFLFLNVDTKEIYYIYDSFWVLETMKGKGNYIDYLKGKFDAIKKTGSKVDAGIVFQSKIDEYVVAIGQDGIRDAALQIWAKGGKITHMWMRPIGLVGLK